MKLIEIMNEHVIGNDEYYNIIVSIPFYVETPSGSYQRMMSQPNDQIHILVEGTWLVVPNKKSVSGGLTSKSESGFSRQELDFDIAHKYVKQKSLKQINYSDAFKVDYKLKF